MVGDTLIGNGDVFHPGSGARGFGKISRTAFPQYIRFPSFDAFDIRFDAFVVPDRYPLNVILIRPNLIKTMRFAEGRVFPRCYQLFKNLFLFWYSTSRPALDIAGNFVGKRFDDAGTKTHCAEL